MVYLQITIHHVLNLTAVVSLNCFMHVKVAFAYWGSHTEWNLITMPLPIKVYHYKVTTRCIIIQVRDVYVCGL